MPEEVRTLRRNANSVVTRWDVLASGDPGTRLRCAQPTGLRERKDEVLGESSAIRKLELRSDIPASHIGSRSTTPLLRNPTEVRHCSQHAGANVNFGDEGAVDWAFLGNLKQLRALLLG